MTERLQILAAAKEVGFEAAGIASLRPLPYPGVIRRWVAGGNHADMRWFERRLAEREDPEVYAPGTSSLLCVALNCYSGEQVDFPIAMYARGIDYHSIFAEKLDLLSARVSEILPGCRTLACCDTSPVMERAWAERAGIGWIGKSGQLISGRFGTWLMLGEILIDRAIEADVPHTDHCGTCDRCVRACPTAAIRGDRTVDSRRCISYLTIEHRGEFDEAMRGAVSGHLFGCDDCLTVCPFNRFQRETNESRMRPGEHLRSISAIPTMEEDEFRRLFRGTPLTRPKLAGMLRNLAAQRT